MKKTVLLLVMLLMTFTVRAQSTHLTICEGDYYSRSVPIYGLWADVEGTMGQMIYPSNMLTDMKSFPITSLTFYTDYDLYIAYDLEPSSQSVICFENVKLQLSLLEIDQSNFTSYEAISGATPVATTVPVKGEKTMRFEFDQPFEYNGGNLLVEVKVIEAGEYGTTEFWGAPCENNQCLYSYTGFNDVATTESFAFLPKVTFEYINPDLLDYTISPYGWGTFYTSSANYSLPDDVKAYAVTGVLNDMVTLAEINPIPAGTPVLINGTPNTIYTFRKVSGTFDPPSVNYLRGTDVDMEIQASSGTKYFILTTKNDVFGFYYAAEDGGTFTNKANKAYLYLPDDGYVKSLNLPDFDNTTAIQTTPQDKPVNNTPAYNLSGQRVSDSYRGIMIVNGKKILVK